MSYTQLYARNSGHTEHSQEMVKNRERNSGHQTGEREKKKIPSVKETEKRKSVKVTKKRRQFVCPLAWWDGTISRRPSVLYKDSVSAASLQCSSDEKKGESAHKKK